MKRQRFLLCILLIFCVSPIHSQEWIPLGSAINGDTTYCKFGSAVDFNALGSRLVIGANGYRNNLGKVSVFEYDSGEWLQVGESILGSNSSSKFGSAVSMNYSGHFISTINAGLGINPLGIVRVYDVSEMIPQQIGGDITEDNAGDLSTGSGISMSSDANVVAIGEFGNDDVEYLSGRVRVFENLDGEWIRRGQILRGSRENQRFGMSVSVNDIGNVLAVGSPYNNGFALNQGVVTVFQYDAAGDVWLQKGNDIIGIGGVALSGYSVSLDSTGNMLAIGFPGELSDYTWGGSVRVYSYDSGNWVLIGNELYGDADYELFGKSVRLSGDGSYLMVAIPDYKINGETFGCVRVFELQANHWVNVCELIGENVDNMFGSSACINHDGSRIAIGVEENDSVAPKAGQVCVYELFTPVNIVGQPQSVLNACLGEEVFFEVVATDAISYQWQENGENGFVDIIDDENYQNSQTPILTLNEMSEDMDGKIYRCIITNDIGITMSHIAELQMNVAFPEVLSMPEDQVLYSGQNCHAVLPDYRNDIVANDICDTSLTIEQIPTPGSLLFLEDNPVSFLISNAHGFSTEVSMNVFVLDTIAPQLLSEPTNIVYVVENGCDTLLPDYTDAFQWFDSCDTTLIVSQNPTPGEIISDTINPVEITCTDYFGNVTSFNFNVALYETVPPVIESQHVDTFLIETCECGAFLPDYTESCIVQESCSYSLVQQPESGTLISGTSNPVVITAQDAYGNTAVEEFNVKVVDKTRPQIISQHSDIVLFADNDCSVELPDYTIDIDVYDCCDSAFTYYQSPVPGTSLSLGDNQINLKVEDDAGNIDKLIFNLEVIDTIPPQILCDEYDTVLINAGNQYLIQGEEFIPLIINDNCGVTELSNDYNLLPDLTGECLPVGETEIVWTVEDESNNQNTCAISVFVNEDAYMSNYSSGNISVTPNPITERVCIISENYTGFLFKVYGMHGEIVFESFITECNEEFDLSFLSKGLYIIEFSSDSFQYFEKLVKQ